MQGPNPGMIFDMMNAYQRSAVLRGAIELGLFTQIAAGKQTAAELAAACKANERGVRILCDYLVVSGLLTKSGNRYANTADTAMFLDQKSRAYMGGAVEFLNAEHIEAAFEDIAAVVRKGGTVYGEKGSTEDNHVMWENFARAMGGLAYPQAMSVAGLLGDSPRPMKVLDVAASHGIFGIAVAQKNPQAQVVGLDWENVLPMARENAKKFGVADRYSTIAGDVFKVDLGGPYDAVLIPNLLHHFDADQNVAMLKRIHAATRPGGKVVIVEFVVAEDRITPPASGAFAMIMLASTPRGDVYTFKEYEQMLSRAGYKNAEQREIGHGIQVAVIGQA